MHKNCLSIKKHCRWKFFLSFFSYFWIKIGIIFYLFLKKFDFQFLANLFLSSMLKRQGHKMPQLTTLSLATFTRSDGCISSVCVNSNDKNRAKFENVSTKKYHQNPASSSLAHHLEAPAYELQDCAWRRCRWQGILEVDITEAYQK